MSKMCCFRRRWHCGDYPIRRKAVKMNQNERLDYLVEQFKEDSGKYRNLETPADPEEKKHILRSLMNIRMPRMMAPSVLAVQDEYLQERNRENGIVEISDIPTIADQGSSHQIPVRFRTSVRGPDDRFSRRLSVHDLLSGPLAAEKGPE